jgi:hypothetical protein
VVPCKIKDTMLETGTRNFRHNNEAEALASIPDDFIEMEHEYMPMVFGDSYRRIFVHKQDMAGNE